MPWPINLHQTPGPGGREVVCMRRRLRGSETTLDRSTVAWAIVAGALAAGIAFGRPAATTTVPSEPLVLGPQAAGTVLTVHVSGWVAEPGLVELDPGARVADALARAGGMRPGATAGSLNLAQAVVDGMRIHVPGPGEVAGAPASSSDGKVVLNQASAGEIERLPGVGPVLAARIVAYRDEHGPFESPEDLLDVSGIGESKLDAIRDLIAVP